MAVPLQGIWPARTFCRLPTHDSRLNYLRPQQILQRLAAAREARYAALAEWARREGLSAVAICTRHLIPNVAPLIVSQATLLFAYAMVDLAAISFIGLGVQPPQADWGVMVATGKTGVLQGYPAESLAAGLCIVLVVVAVNLLGERLAARREARG